MYYKNKKQRPTIVVGNANGKVPSKNKRENNLSSMGQRKPSKIPADQTLNGLSDEKLFKMMGKRKTNSYLGKHKPLYDFDYFFKKHRELGIVSSDYMLNHYNSLDRIGKRNLKEFFNGLSNNSIVFMSEIFTLEDNTKYVKVGYKYGLTETTALLWYMPGMKKLVQLSANYNFELDLSEIIKQAYIKK